MKTYDKARVLTLHKKIKILKIANVYKNICVRK